MGRELGEEMNDDPLADFEEAFARTFRQPIPSKRKVPPAVSRAMRDMEAGPLCPIAYVFSGDNCVGLEAVEPSGGHLFLRFVSDDFFWRPLPLFAGYTSSPTRTVLRRA